MIEISEKDFENEVVNSKIPVLIDFWATWCVPCKIIAPIVEEISREYDGKLKVVKINTDENPGLAAKFGIMSIPTLMLFKNGQAVERIIGVVPKNQIKEKIESII